MPAEHCSFMLLADFVEMENKLLLACADAAQPIHRFSSLSSSSTQTVEAFTAGR